MSWFGGNLPQLSSITDQISSFTKEVLTETTEEVEDPTAELQIARRKIDELENLNKHIQAEWDKVKKHSEEQSERAETAEYQIATISQEYRKLLHERDEELRRLKVDREKLKEQQKGLVVHGKLDGLSPQSPLKELASAQFFSEDLLTATKSHHSSIHNGPGAGGVGGGEGFEAIDLEEGNFHDFDDVISSQSEINRLQSELARLKAESHHWKAVAHQKDHSLESEIMESDVTQLKAKIEELELSIQQEMAQHQRELSGLQTVQNERVSSLSQRHQDEVDQLQRRINELERASFEGGRSATNSATQAHTDGKEAAVMKRRCAQLEAEVEKLTRKMDEMEKESPSGTDKVKEEQIEQLSSENLRLSQINGQLENELKREQLNNRTFMQATMSVLHKEVATLREQVSLKKDSTLATLEHEKVQLASKLANLQTSISEQETIMSRLKQDHGKSQLEVEQLTGEVERLSREVKEREGEIHSLRGVLTSDSKDKEKTASNLASVARELEERNRVVSELQKSLSHEREMAEERERELGSQKQLVREATDREVALKRQCAELEQRHSCEIEQLKHQAKESVKKFQSVQHETSATTKERESVSQLQDELIQSKTLLEETRREVAESLSEKDALLKHKEGEVGELSRRLEVAASELQSARAEVVRVSAEKEILIQQRNTLQREVASLSQFRGQLESKVQSLEEGGRSAQDELNRQLESKKDECVKYGKQLANLKAHLIEVEERYTQEAVLADQRESSLKQEVAKLQEQLKASSHHGAMQSEQTQLQLESAQRELQLLVEERDDALLQMANAQEQAKQNATALRNLQAVLEEFQRDQSSELSQALKRSQNELASALEETQQLKGEMEDLRAQLMEANSVAEAAAILNQELEDKEKKMTELNNEIDNCRANLAQKEEELRKQSQIETDRVDRSLVKNLVLGYIHANDRKKPEVIQLIHKILEFSPEELDMAMRGAEGGGWLSGLWRRQPTTPTTPPPDQTTSLSRLFVSFLESESTPVSKPHPPILPTSATAKPPGYIDPRTDPDRPSLATVPLLKPHPPSHSSSVSGVTKPVPDKPGHIPIPKLETTSLSTSMQVGGSQETRPSEQNKPTTSSLFLFTPVRLSSADSAGSSSQTSRTPKSSQSSILRNVLSE